MRWTYFVWNINEQVYYKLNNSLTFIGIISLIDLTFGFVQIERIPWIVIIKFANDEGVSRKLILNKQIPFLQVHLFHKLKVTLPLKHSWLKQKYFWQEASVLLMSKFITEIQFNKNFNLKMQIFLSMRKIILSL